MNAIDEATLAVIGIVLLFIAYLRGYHDGIVAATPKRPENTR